MKLTKEQYLEVQALVSDVKVAEQLGVEELHVTPENSPHLTELIITSDNPEATADEITRLIARLSGVDVVNVDTQISVLDLGAEILGKAKDGLQSIPVDEIKETAVDTVNKGLALGKNLFSKAESFIKDEIELRQIERELDKIEDEVSNQEVDEIEEILRELDALAEKAAQENTENEKISIEEYLSQNYSLDDNEEVEGVNLGETLSKLGEKINNYASTLSEKVTSKIDEVKATDETEPRVISTVEELEEWLNEVTEEEDEDEVELTEGVARAAEKITSMFDEIKSYVGEKISQPEDEDNVLSFDEFVELLNEDECDCDCDCDFPCYEGPVAGEGIILTEDEADYFFALLDHKYLSDALFEVIHTRNVFSENYLGVDPILDENFITDFITIWQNPELVEVA